ncbi:Hydantoinase B/oxoprolinase-domain-containing protein [Naematelia encephala]|uniref:Hydantoinase B/oxoprolinase-domain-containing protein n=1 Tax=Naematelia encephala TaxID=71784 RepID=A0A1Y2BJV8_9TREE|nr:Hydantoinase B/oxoprolinase-domain-containing protein [Naematelia encephala]
MSDLIRIAIDRGGTFTDVHCSRSGHEDIVIKLLSVDPANYSDAPTEGIRRCLEASFDEPVPKGSKINLDKIESIRMGTTVATNALLERQGERCALVTTKGFRDLLRIGKQARPDIFDLTVTKLSYLYDTVIEINERVTIETFLMDPDPQPIDLSADSQLVKGTTGEILRVLERPNLVEVGAQLDELWFQGYRSIAVALLHSWTFPEHEAEVAALARRKGFSVSVSHELQPTIKILSRANSATADAYLSPVTRRYLESFGQGFEGGLDGLGDKLLLMQSDGGLCRWDRFSGLRAVLSGPAGGVIGYSKICYDPKEGTAVVAVDMGGTSTDVSRYAGSLEHVTETTTAQVILTATSLDVNTVAAGGGSRLFWQNNMFVVGPQSAGAHPGPVSYGKGGPLAVTDANLLLGRLLPEQFPKIFGPNEDQPLDVAATRKAFEDLAVTINAEKKGEELTVEEIASGFLEVANEAMCRPIRTLTEARGFSTAEHNLVIFGGAGGQHGCAIASALNIRRIIVPKFSSILSAYGMSLADIVEEVQEPSALTTAEEHLTTLYGRGLVLRKQAVARLVAQGFPDERIQTEVFYNCRYKGASTALMVPAPADGDLESAFIEQHKSLFGFTLADRLVFVDDVRVRATGLSESKVPPSLFDELNTISKKAISSEVYKEVYYSGNGWLKSAILPLKSMKPGDVVEGPALLYDATQTILVEPGFKATALTDHVILDAVGDKKAAGISLDHWDPVQLSVFGHRFMSIAEQMGSILRQTAISVNIKERLDFSCALFDPNGNLCANAPDMPAHLGAMSHAVRHQVELWKGQLEDGDVFVSNHPAAGGSHLPDITVMTPAFHEGEIVFWTASRAHHADIGGIRAGSMPPFSTEIWQEGAMIKSFKLVKKGIFDEPGITKLLFDDPGSYPGCSGTRTLSDNISDLKAQVSSNYRGITLIKALCQQYGTPVVQHYMLGIQNAAELAVRNLLKRVGEKFHGVPLEAEDYLDDGSTIRLKITIDAKEGSAIFDFTGTSKQVYGNLNAPTAILFSAILYTLRCLINVDMPLNYGCLIPITLIVPPGCLLAPSEDAATVAGNVETSQRMTDTIFKAFRACGASQGSCNNFTFGYGETGPDGTFRGFGFYETIAGGSGGGAAWDGQSGTHVHMSNTSIGDVEISERNYPMIIREYAIRKGSGGAGRHPGGEGCVRAVEFTRDVDFAILSERRTVAPYGMLGGEPGKRGENLWIRHRDGVTATINLGGKNQMRVKAGDTVIIKTPGGGGFGKPGSEDDGEAMQYITTKIDRPPVRGSGSVSQFRETQFTS